MRSNIKEEDKRAQCTREQVDRWNAKLSNRFRLDLERFIIWNDKVATRSIELPDGKVLKADIGWTEVREEPREEAKKHMAELQNDVVA